MSGLQTRRRTQSSGRKLDADAWIQAALDALAEDGLSAVAVEPLARRMGVTKGSFYWHFKNRDALLAATLEFWEQRYTERAVQSFAEVANPSNRLPFMFERAVRLDRGDKIHLALSGHTDHPLIGPYFQRGTRRRISYLEDCYRELGLEGEQARHRAILIYTAYLGLLHLRREGPAELPSTSNFPTYLDHVVTTFQP